MASTLDLAAGDARLTVAPSIGGAIAAFTWRGHDVLRRTPPEALAAGDVRSCACYALVPYSNRIRDARLRFDGRDHTLARNFGDHPHALHGVGWQRAWRVAAHEGDTLQLSLEHDAVAAAARQAWPWSFRATQALGVAESADGMAVLHATLTLENRADERFPFGLGWHPYFPKSADTALCFHAASVWCNDATQIPVQSAPVPVQWGYDSPRPLADAVLDNVFNGWTGMAELEQPTAGLRARIAADRACGRLVVYAPAGRDFVALEPVTHETDAFNRAAAGAFDTGMRVLGPGEAFSCTMRLTVAVIA